MYFRFRSNPLTRATASAAGFIFIVGLMLIGFAFLVFILKDLFALLAAMIFIMAGIATIGFSIRLFLASGGFKNSDYRRNVRIHHRQTNWYNF